MPDPVLFPLHEDLLPDPSRTEPLVWIRRLVILSEANPASIVREVPFERGLNIVRTEERADLEENVVAHSVGKTLLMRLVRYTLGEPNYAAEESQVDLAKVLRDGVVVAHWRVDGNDWIVRRPLHDHDPNAAYCIRWPGGDTSPTRQRVEHEVEPYDHSLALRACMEADERQRIPFRLFLKQLDAAVVGDLPTLEIAKDRGPKWPDLLGWFARDCECGYRQANEWRHADTNLGQPGDLNVNKLMMQWLCGLMGEDETKLRNGHRQLLSDQRKAKSSSEKHSRTASFGEESLRDSMQRPKETEASSADGDKFLSGDSGPSLTETAESMLASSREVLKEVRENSPVAKLESKVSAIQIKLGQANRAAGEASGNLTSTKKYQRDLKSVQSDPPILKKCQADPCELRDQLQRHRELGQDDAIDQKLSDAVENLERQTELEEAARKACEFLTDELKAASGELGSAKTTFTESEAKLNEQIGRWQQHVVDAKRVDAVLKESVKLETNVSSHIKSIDNSNAKQDTARDTMDHRQRVAQASVAYTQVLQRVFNDAATGTIQVDGNGLQPKPAKQLTPGGRALSAMATVVSFDLACVMASIAGAGNHPRFLIHDSPREGEMEMPLFKRIFDVACYLESCFGDSPPSFQYIVTTTKAPPSYCTESEPHTRVVLHGRADHGRLLKVTF